MAKNNKNNPVTLGIMGVVLVGALFSVGKSLFSGDGPQAARKPAAEAAGDTPAAEPRITGLLPASLRDPFSSTLNRRADPHAVNGGPAAASSSALLPVPQLRAARTRPIGPILSAVPITFRAAPVTDRGPADAAKARIAIDEEALARAFRVTAIVMGADPYAVLEAAGRPPRTLHKAEAFQTLRMVAVRPTEIVLKGQSGIWTLPLTTPDNDPAQQASGN